MSEPQKIKCRLLEASYVKEAQSILLLLECEKGRFRTQMHRNTIATFGNRTEEEIEKEMEKYVDILKSNYLYKPLYMVFDPDLDNKIEDNYPLKY